MSFDLKVWHDPEGRFAGREDERYEELGEIEEQDVLADAPRRELAPPMRAFVDALGEALPFGEDPVWASWPPDVVTESAIALNLRWDDLRTLAEPRAAAEVARIAHEHGMTVYDPQVGRVVPSGRPSP